MEGIDKVQGKRKKTRPPRGAARRSNCPHTYSHPFEVRRKAVQLCLEESFPVERVAREMGVGRSTLSKWVRLYRDQGEAGLQSKSASASRPRPKVAAAVKAEVVALKRRHPDLGIKKISQFLRRMLFLPVSRETVRRTLHQQQLLKKPRRKPPCNPPKPRFFERSTPNQMWQTDIFTFRLGGKNAYLIGFHRRSFPLRGGAGGVSQPDGGARVRGVPPGGGGVRRAQRDALRSRPPVRELARDHPVRGGVAQGSGSPHQKPAPSSHDPGQDRTLLENHLGGVPGARAVRQLRVGRRADSAVGEALQPPAAAPVPGGVVSGRSLLCHCPGTAPSHRARHPGERVGTGVAGATAQSLLHGGADGRAVRGHSCREG